MTVEDRVIIGELRTSVTSVQEEGSGLMDASFSILEELGKLKQRWDSGEPARQALIEQRAVLLRMLRDEVEVFGQESPQDAAAAEELFTKILGDNHLSGKDAMHQDVIDARTRTALRKLLSIQDTWSNAGVFSVFLYEKIKQGEDVSMFSNNPFGLIKSFCSDKTLHLLKILYNSDEKEKVQEALVNNLLISGKDYRPWSRLDIRYEDDYDQTLRDYFSKGWDKQIDILLAASSPSVPPKGESVGVEPRQELASTAVEVLDPSEVEEKVTYGHVLVEDKRIVIKNKGQWLLLSALDRWPQAYIPAQYLGNLLDINDVNYEPSNTLRFIAKRLGISFEEIISTHGYGQGVKYRKKDNLLVWGEPGVDLKQFKNLEVFGFLNFGKNTFLIASPDVWGLLKILDGKKGSPVPSTTLASALRARGFDILPSNVIEKLLHLLGIKERQFFSADGRKRNKVLTPIAEFSISKA